MYARENIELRRGILDILVRQQDDLSSARHANITTFISNLKQITDPSYLRVILELAKNSDGIMGARHGVIRSVNSSEEQRLRITHANLDSIKESGLGIEDFFGIRIHLANDHGVYPDENLKLHTIQAHAYANHEYRNYPHGHEYGDCYMVDREYMAAVEKYHEHVHALVAYRNELGILDFDEDDFQRYLSLGALSKGWL